MAVAALVAAVGCGESRYRREACPGSVFPEAAEILRRPAFRRLEYFQGTADSRLPVNYETWADQRFEFTTSLRYHYPREDPRRVECAAAVVFMVKHPPTTAAEGLGLQFIALFEEEWGRDLSRLRSAYAAHGRGAEGPAADHREDLAGIVAEISIVHSALRGELLSVGFYEPGYYRSAFPKSAPPDSGSPAPGAGPGGWR
jgi:hypothetical protein